MEEISLKKKRTHFFTPVYFDIRSPRKMLSIMMLLGVAAGTLIGTYSSGAAIGGGAGSYFKAFSEELDLIYCLKESAQFFLYAAIISSSFLGFFVIPALAAFRGYLLGFSVAVLFSSFSYTGLYGAAFIFGIPAVLTLPPFLVISADAYYLSEQLFAQRFGRNRSWEQVSFGRHLFFSLPFVAAAFFYDLYFLPDILLRFI